MTDRIEEIRARCEAATPGPWEDSPAGYIYQKATGHVDVVTFVGGCGEQAVSDAEFIAHAREDIPYLLSQLAERDKEIERLREAQRWIPVTERLPEDGAECLALKRVFNIQYTQKCTYSANMSEVDSNMDGEGAGFYAYDSEWGYYNVDNITHWMQIPEPPKEGAEK